MEPVTRRKFIVAGSAGALGVAGATLGPRLADGAESAMGDEPELSRDEISRLGGNAMLAVRDAGAGEVEVLIGDRSVVFTDKRLVARVVRAAR
jgi:hypothetical protein